MSIFVTYYPLNFDVVTPNQIYLQSIALDDNAAEKALRSRCQLLKDNPHRSPQCFNLTVASRGAPPVAEFLARAGALPGVRRQGLAVAPVSRPALPGVQIARTGRNRTSLRTFQYITTCFSHGTSI